jgi:hypothetical protein
MCFSFYDVCLTHIKVFYSMNVFFFFVNSSKPFCISICLSEYLIWLPAILLCHLQHHKNLYYDWWQRYAALQQIQNPFYDLLNWQKCHLYTVMLLHE